MSNSAPGNGLSSIQATSLRERLSVFPGIVVVILLLIYTAAGALGRSGPETAVATQPPAQRSDLARSSVSINNPGGSIAFSREFYIFMVCDGETAEAVYSGHISQLYATLRPARDRQTMLDLLEGRPTPLPDYARTFQSPCFQTAIENGTFP